MATDSFAARLARLEEGQRYTIKALETIHDDQQGAKNSIRTMLYSLFVGLVVMIIGFALTLGAR